MCDYKSINSFVGIDSYIIIDNLGFVLNAVNARLKVLSIYIYMYLLVYVTITKYIILSIL